MERDDVDVAFVVFARIAYGDGVTIITRPSSYNVGVGWRYSPHIASETDIYAPRARGRKFSMPKRMRASNTLIVQRSNHLINL